jgi:23S rRNA (adenine2503-C2)-methyltransferase
MPIILQEQTPESLCRHFPELTISEARKIISVLFRFGTWQVPMPQVRRVQREQVRTQSEMPELVRVAEQVSSFDRFMKITLEVKGGHQIETVRIPLERAGRYSLCLSSQAGCALACSFCATGRMGLKRNLEVWEIVEQVRVMRSTLEIPKERIHGIVFQGMGEPMANLDRVIAAIRVVTEPSGLAIDTHNITICTSGLPTGIRRIAQELPRVRLALSLGSVRHHQRKQLMPITNTHSLQDVMEAAAVHARTTGYAPLWAITLLQGINDQPEEAIALAELVKKFTEQVGVRPRVSVIPYNSISDEDDPFRRTADDAQKEFLATLRSHGVFGHVRYSGGGEVNAACGQLAARSRPQTTSDVNSSNYVG